MIPSKKKLTINYADGSSKIFSLQTNKNNIWPYLWKFKTKDQIKQEQTSCVELNDVRKQESKGRSLEVGQGTKGLLHLFSNRVAISAWKHDWIGRLTMFMRNERKWWLGKCFHVNQVPLWIVVRTSTSEKHNTNSDKGRKGDAHPVNQEEHGMCVPR